MISNATSFGAQAAHYAAARPTYPDALFDWIADAAPGRGLVWDVGTGSGQAARALAGRFGRVRATDIDAAQIAAAAPHDRIDYVVAPEMTSGLPDSAADAVTVATALHWFDLPAFWGEVRRTARLGAVFAAWTYHRIDADAELMGQLVEPVLAIVDPYWSEGNRLSWRGYPADEIGFPFAQLDTPEFACSLRWTPTQTAEFLRSWSAHARARDDGKADVLAAVEADVMSALGDAPRRVRLPLAMIAGRIG